MNKNAQQSLRIFKVLPIDEVVVVAILVVESFSGCVVIKAVGIGSSVVVVV